MKKILIATAAMLFSTSAFAEPALVSSGVNKVLNVSYEGNQITYVVLLGGEETYNGCAITTQQDTVTLTMMSVKDFPKNHILYISHKTWDFGDDNDEITLQVRMTYGESATYKEGETYTGEIGFTPTQDKIFVTMTANDAFYADFLGPNRMLEILNEKTGKADITFDLNGFSQSIIPYLNCLQEVERVNKEETEEHSGVETNSFWETYKPWMAHNIVNIKFEPITYTFPPSKVKVTKVKF